MSMLQIGGNKTMSMLQIGGNRYDLLKQTTRVLLLVVFCMGCSSDYNPGGFASGEVGRFKKSFINE